MLESLEGVSRIAIDTTHGVNYFAVALVEASRLAATIHLLKNSMELKDVEIYRYNSDPVVGRPHGEVKINLLSSERLGGLAASYLAHAVENLVATHGSIFKTASYLQSSWKKIERESWEVALSAAILLVRGAPTWALRVAREAKVPTRGEVVKRLEEAEIECREKDGKTVCSYSWGSEMPTKDVVVIGELVSTLKKLEEDLHCEQCVENARCYDLEKLKTVVERVYPRNVAHLFTHEVEKLRKALGGVRDAKALRFKPGEIDPRNLYAHAGLAQG
ncbi:MAG: hypothetical protein ACK4M3_08315, partial [Pyrobaculum sp.]